MRGSNDLPTDAFYQERAAELAEIYDTVAVTHLHHLSTLLRPGDRVLDVGVWHRAGCGVAAIAGVSGPGRRSLKRDAL